jgi:hypothetical protein
MLNPNSATDQNLLTGVQVRVVDSVGVVGRWTNISLDSGGNPWIAYIDESNLGSMDGVKMAFRDSNMFTKELNDVFGQPITGWETIHVPAQFRVENARLGMECFPARNFTGTPSRTPFWSAAVGFLSPPSGASQMFYRVAYYVR